MRTISFYSYKGGSGRTLLVANIAKYLARFGQKVVAVDFDLEAPGLHYKFNLDRPDTPIRVIHGLVDYIYAFAVDGKVPARLEDFVVSVPVPPVSKGSIQLMPAGAAPLAEYWRKLSRINWHDWFYAPGARGVQFFLEMKEQIREQLKPDFLLIDARTGVTEIGGVATSLLPEKVVCLVLNTRENLEGARAVLRSLKKAPRLPHTPTCDVVPVLTRVLDFRDPEREQAALAAVRDFLNAKAEKIEDTLSIEEIFVLHSEPDLQVSESLRIGSDKSLDESPLLRDYLRLFSNLIPTEILREHIGSLIGQAKARAFEDPEGTQRDLEALTQLGHQDAYRELLKFYRLRKGNITGAALLKAARRLWDITRDGKDPLLQGIVKSTFKEIAREEEGPGGREILPFVEDVWRSDGGRNVDLGCDLAESYDNFRQRDHAATLLLELAKNVGADEKTLAKCLKQLIRAGRAMEAAAFIEKFRPALSKSLTLTRVWAECAIEREEDMHISELLEAPAFSVLLAEELPTLAIRLLLRAKQPEKAKELAKRALPAAIREGPSPQLEELASVFRQLDAFDEFGQALRARFGEEGAERFLRDLGRGAHRYR